MTVGELRRQLEDYDDDTPVICFHQEHYPLAEDVRGVVSYHEVLKSDQDLSEEELLGRLEETPEFAVVVLRDGQPQDFPSPYGNADAWNLI